ncbi:MAG: hypothetical protein RLZZ512_1828, partial [Bacteroidota bacterium]
MVKINSNWVTIARLKSLFLILGFLLCSLGAKADHVMGSDMGYQCLGGGKY